MRLGSLFAGIGGFDIAARAMGWRTAWFVEWDRSCQHWLAEHFPGVPIHGDITQVPFEELEPVDILCGGFPCQPVSHAGKRAAQADARWLWPEFARAIRVLRPRYVAIENTPGLLSAGVGADGTVCELDERGMADGSTRAVRRAMGDVLGSLADCGYDAEWGVLSCAAIGAPHERRRVWILAYPDGGRCEQRDARDGAAAESGAGLAALGDAAGGGRGAGAGEHLRRAERGRAELEYADVSSATRQRPNGGAQFPQPAEHGGGSGELGDPDRTGLLESRGAESVPAPHAAVERGGGDVCGWDDAVPVRGGDGQLRLVPREAADEGAQSPLWPVADGVPGRVARLRAIGNAASPAWVVQALYRRIAEREAAGCQETRH